LPPNSLGDADFPPPSCSISRLIRSSTQPISEGYSRTPTNSPSRNRAANSWVSSSLPDHDPGLATVLVWLGFVVGRLKDAGLQINKLTPESIDIRPIEEANAHTEMAQVQILAATQSLPWVSDLVHQALERSGGREAIKLLQAAMGELSESYKAGQETERALGCDSSRRFR
jgi:hypothetical protein